MSTDINACKEIMDRAMHYLIDLESGCFERLLMAAKEVFNLKRDHLSDEMVGVYLEFVAAFDRSKGNEHQDFIWQSVADMDDEKKRELGDLIVKLYALAYQDSAAIKERKRITDKVMEFQNKMYEELTSQ